MRSETQALVQEAGLGKYRILSNDGDGSSFGTIAGRVGCSSSEQFECGGSQLSLASAAGAP